MLVARPICSLKVEVSDLLPKRYLGMHLSSWEMWFGIHPGVHYPSGEVIHQPEEGLTHAAHTLQKARAWENGFW